MSFKEWLTKANEKMQEMKEAKPMFGFALALGIVVVFACMMLVVPAQAGTLNDSVYVLIEDVADLFTPILDLVIAAIPVIIAGAIITFILGILARILGHI